MSLLALSWIDEHGYFGHFPGEVWGGKTWLEQNRIPAPESRAARALIDRAPGPLHVRYLTEDTLAGDVRRSIDEVGYLFHPARHGHRFDAFWASLPGRARRKVAHECASLETQGLSFRFDVRSDVEALLRLNTDTWGERSYFHDARFRRAFESTVAWLDAAGGLRVTTILVRGAIAAVDVGGVHGSTYTLLAGGTNPEFPGIAKVINLHHLQRACCERFSVVDFLCGDFGWKARLGLTPRPLYAVDTRQHTVMARPPDAPAA